MQSRTKISERHLVASFATYHEPERAVDSLSDAGFEVERLTIADQLQLAAKVTGRRGHAQEALGSGASGAVIGATQAGEAIRRLPSPATARDR